MAEPDNFYDDIPEFTDFNEVSDGFRYKPAPDDWWIIAGDIRNSTQAIENGKYKEVNMAGATIIAAVSNLYKDMGALPFTFGGDGAIVLVPDARISEARKTLSFCRKAIRESFGLDMRVGMMLIRDVREAGHDVRVAKLKLSSDMSQAVFWGGGLTYAESVIKEIETIDENEDDYHADLDGLECRWEEIPPSEDEITSYIIQARGKTDFEQSSTYANCLEKINEVYGPMSQRNPVSVQKMKMTKSWKKMQAEWKIRTWKPTLRRRFMYAIKLMYEAIGGEIVMNNNITARGVEWGDYKTDFVKHVDFRKFDEGLRFVASGTVQERTEMQKFLDSEYAAGTLFYGTHSSDSLIVTCYITNHQKKHIHFVDGIDGGYALAAKKLKKQMSQVQ